MTTLFFPVIAPLSIWTTYKHRQNISLRETRWPRSVPRMFAVNNYFLFAFSDIVLAAVPRDRMQVVSRVKTNYFGFAALGVFFSLFSWTHLHSINMSIQYVYNHALCCDKSTSGSHSQNWGTYQMKFMPCSECALILWSFWTFESFQMMCKGRRQQRWHVLGSWTLKSEKKAQRMLFLIRKCWH